MPVLLVVWPVIAATAIYRLFVGPGLGVNVPSKISAFRQELPDMFTSSFISQERGTVTAPHPPPPNETLQDQQVGLAQDHMKSLLLPWILGHMEILCVSSKSRVSVLPSPVELLQSISTDLQSKCSGDSQARKPDVGLSPVGELL